jgi:hypothetical protein
MGRVQQMSRQYPWEQYYEAAILETDRSRLPALIKAAQAAIHSRLDQLNGVDGQSPERAVLAKALRGIQVLQGETH